MACRTGSHSSESVPGQRRGYVNHLDLDEGNERVRQAYGAETWARLVALKRRLDPDNVFHLNQNVPPSD